LRNIKKYYFDTTTNTFERFVVPLRKKVIRIFGFISGSVVLAIIMAAIAFKYLDSPKAKITRTEIGIMNEKYQLYQAEIDELNKSIKELESRDNQIYRAIFEATPLPDSIRFGKNYSEIDFSKYKYKSVDEILESMEEKIAVIKNRIQIQKKSYDSLQIYASTKEAMLKRIPAIQPVSNKDLSRVASGFGYRIDPVYKTPKMHTGLDFAAPIGTPIYATADGTIREANFDAGGYGNHVIINHGYGYQTLYGHMIRIKARGGEQVKRGQVIGYVGSTGKSTGPHCHYEVIKNNTKIDPIHYFFNDLSPTDYERMIKISAANNQSFD
jgi:murein DD-endopeptidase MepM/ murein hydrolase activator NlpD